MSNSASLLSEGLVVADSYEIEHLLGRGGMGEVWLARHRRLAGKQVAVKVLRTGGQLGPEALSRFRREAEIAARLEHPNIVQVLDFNTLATGEPFIVMELLKGESLAARLRRGPLPLEQVRAVVRQVGSALQAAHAAGIVHRDLKPENIFLLPTALGDQVKVLDFGISKLADSGSLQTTDSVLIGTPLYMSPEQATGHNREITHQSDLFSLGSICYELLSGQAPFAADNIAKVVFRIAYEPHVPLAKVVPGLPASVTDAVEHALAKDKANRTRDIDAFVLEFSGQAMGAAVRESSAGLYKPGMPVTESMMGGATMTPSVPAMATPNAGLATPAPAPTRPPTAAGGTKVSRRGLFFLLSGAGALLAAAASLMVVLAPLDVPMTDKEVPVEREAEPSVVVAATPGAERGKVEADAGLADAELGARAVAVAPRDAGAPAVQPPDAGAVMSARKPKPEVLSLEDQETMERVHDLERKENWDELYAGWSSLANNLTSESARREVYFLAGIAACHRHDQRNVKGMVRRLEKHDDEARARRLEGQCKKLWDGYTE